MPTVILVQLVLSVTPLGYRLKQNVQIVRMVITVVLSELQVQQENVLLGLCVSWVHLLLNQMELICQLVIPVLKDHIV